MLIIFFLLPLFLPLLSTVISSLPIWSLQNPSGRTLPFWYSIPSPILYATSQKLGGSRRGQTGAIEKFCSPKNFAPFLSKLIWLLATRFGCFARGRPSGLLEVNFPQTLNNSGRSWALFSWTVDSLPLKFLGCSARGGTSSSLQIFFFNFSTLHFQWQRSRNLSGRILSFARACQKSTAGHTGRAAFPASSSSLEWPAADCNPAGRAWAIKTPSAVQ